LSSGFPQAVFFEVWQRDEIHFSENLLSDPLPLAATSRYRNSRSADASIANTVAVKFCGHPALAVPVPLHGARVPVTSLQLNRAATGRGGSAQRGKAGRERGPEVNDESLQSLRRCEIGVGKIHVLVDARAIEFRDAVLSRPVTVKLAGWAGVFFITRDSMTSMRAGEFARGRIFLSIRIGTNR